MTDHNDPEFGFDKTAALSEPETAWTAPRSDPQPLTGVSGTPEQPPTNESPHLAAKYWAERNRLRVEVDRLTRERDAARATIARMRTGRP